MTSFPEFLFHFERKLSVGDYATIRETCIEHILGYVDDFFAVILPILEVSWVFIQGFM